MYFGNSILKVPFTYISESSLLLSNSIFNSTSSLFIIVDNVVLFNVIFAFVFVSVSAISMFWLSTFANSLFIFSCNLTSLSILANLSIIAFEYSRLPSITFSELIHKFPSAIGFVVSIITLV